MALGKIAKALDVKVSAIKDTLRDVKLNVTASDHNFNDEFVFVEFTITAPSSKFGTINQALDLADLLVDNESGSSINFGDGDLISGDGPLHTEEFRLEYKNGEFNFFETAGTLHAGFDLI